MLQAVCTLSSGLKEMFGDFTNRQIISNATAVKGRFLRPADAEMLLRWEQEAAHHSTLCIPHKPLGTEHST